MRRFSALTVLFCLVTASHAETYTVCSSGCDYTSVNVAIDAASDGVEVATAGTSCRHQIADATGKRARHWAEILVEAL